MNEHIAGKVVVVTGAAGRLGQRVLHRFAQEGARLAAVVHSAEQARRFQLPEQAEGAVFYADLTHEAQVVACFVWPSQCAHPCRRRLGRAAATRAYAK